MISRKFKMISTKTCAALTVAAFAGVMLAGSAWAGYRQGDRITVLEGFSPGGGSDQLAQLVEPFLAKRMGVTFVNEYIPGAAGAIAWTRLAKTAKKDGYTISITNTPMIFTNYLLNPQIQYSVRDFTPIANVVTDPGILVVGKDSKFKTVKEFLAAAKANPGRITIANSGIGGDDFFSTLFIEKATGLKFQKIPFKGDGPSWTAAMAGKVDASSNNLGITYPQIKAGNLIPLAIYTEKRSPLLPNVPTLKELGINVVAGSSRGISGPKDMPNELRNAIVSALDKIMKDPAFLAAAEKQAMTIDPVLGDDYTKMLFDGERDFKSVVVEVNAELKRQ